MPNVTPSVADQNRFEQLLPFYISRALPAEELEFMRGYITAYPDALEAIQFSEQLRRVIRDTASNTSKNVALDRLVADMATPKKAGLFKRFVAKLRAWGISPPLALAFLVIAGQGVGYVIQKTNWFDSPVSAPAPVTVPHLSVTIKDGADVAAIVVVIEKFGGRVVHSAASSDLGKVLISIIDKTKIPALIDSLIDSGLIESAAVLM